jgi:hypothetical protein
LGAKLGDKRVQLLTDNSNAVNRGMIFCSKNIWLCVFLLLTSKIASPKSRTTITTKTSLVLLPISVKKQEIGEKAL